MWQSCFLSYLMTLLMRDVFFLLLTVSSFLANHWLPNWPAPCKSSDGVQVLLMPPLSLQHLMTSSRTEGPGSWMAVQAPGSKKEACCSPTLLSQNYSIPEQSLVNTMALLLLPSIIKPGVLGLFLFKGCRENAPALPSMRKASNMAGESLAHVQPCITPKCKNNVLDSVYEIPDLPPECQCGSKPVNVFRNQSRHSCPISEGLAGPTAVTVNSLS